MMLSRSPMRSGGQPVGETTLQISDDQNVDPNSKLGSASSCASPVTSATESIKEKARRFGEVASMPLSVSRVASETIVCATVAGDAVGHFSRQSAAMPATNGADSEVPL